MQHVNWPRRANSRLCSKVSATDHGPAQADRGRTSRQAITSAPRAIPPHRALHPLRALGRVPMAPGPAADEDADQQPSAQREWSIIKSDEILVPPALPYARVAAMILTFFFLCLRRR